MTSSKVFPLKDLVSFLRVKQLSKGCKPLSHCPRSI